MSTDRVARCAVSLFSGGGVGDVGVNFGAQVPVIACAEMVHERASTLRSLFPNASVHEGDIWVEKYALISTVRERLQGARPFLLVMSPPCQGMSSNGAGRITAAVVKGTRPKEDQRNRLILPALDIIDALKPDVTILENVKHMLRTEIRNENDQMENVIDVVKRRLSAYRVEIKVIDASQYGVPQRRERLICIATRDMRCPETPLHCPVTHPVPITVWEAIGHLPRLDATAFENSDSHDAFHNVPIWADHHHFCMRHTPMGGTAFDNMTCVHCKRTTDDKQAVICAHCRERLPRPSIFKKITSCARCNHSFAPSLTACPACGGYELVVEEKLRLVRAFRTAYRRMNGNRPSATLTTNSGVISSDVKGHPYQNRVLSVREVLICASLSSFPGFEAPWHDIVDCTFAKIPQKTTREICGESIPCLVMYRLVEHLLKHRQSMFCNH